ncbi:MAG TPA: hypothetical protein VGQ23_05475 [Burkholderiaceae bacterium]|jgi:hypothetical protein|nr:hypothetical protein [Burkholderiaceae bacterium]
MPTIEPAPKALPSPPANRLEWLFRDVLRQGLVHPLIHLMQQYRSEAG